MRFPPATRLASIPVVLALLAAGLCAQSGPVLDGTYTYGSLAGKYAPICGVPASATSGEVGTITFTPAGKFTIQSSEHVACPGGTTWFDLNSVDAGTYTLEPDGQLVLDFDPLFPGTDTIEAWVSWDQEIILAQQAASDDVFLAVLIRNSSGLSDALLQGDYGTVGLGYDQEPGGLTAISTHGSVTLDGSGSYVVLTSWHSVNAAGSQDGTGPDKGTYAVSPDGTLTLDGGVGHGAVTRDGEFGFFVINQDEESELSLFVRKPLVPPTHDALQDLWRLALCAGGVGFAPTGMAPFAGVGDLNCDAALGTWVYNGVLAWADSAGGGSQVDSAKGSISLASDGALTLLPTGGGSVIGWLAAREDIALLANISAAKEAQAMVFLREWGPLSGWPPQLSLSAGGTHALQLRAGLAQASRLYLILGSLSGVHPGFPLGFSTVPLNWDAYTAFTLQTPNSPPLVASFASLDGTGDGLASFVLPAGSQPGLAGLTLWHAAVIVDPLALDLIGLVSNPVPLGLAP